MNVYMLEARKYAIRAPETCSRNELKFLYGLLMGT